MKRGIVFLLLLKYTTTEHNINVPLKQLESEFFA